MRGHQGTLYLCPTPIGNLEDITLRVLRILEEVDIIAAEDTRITIKLLNHYEIKTPQISYHEHNEKTRGVELLELLKAGKDVALVTDAGTPGISDPGEHMVKLALDEGIKVVPLPGAVAGISALVASGLPGGRFAFEGFLPRDKKTRKSLLGQLSGENRTMIFYEAPHRIKNTLKDLLGHFGDREAVLAREITKVYEEFIRGKISQIIEKMKNCKPRGEMVLVVEGAEEIPPDPIDEGLLGDLLKDRIYKLMGQGFSKKSALQRASQEFGISRNMAYDIMLKEKGKK